MLNELLIAERGLARAGVSMTPRHGDIKDVRKGFPTLLVRLDADGCVADVRAVPVDARPWTLGDGNHNRFPFVQPKSPFWQLPPDDPARGVIGGRDATAGRAAVLSLSDRMPAQASAAELIGAKFEKRLQVRSAVLSKDPASVFACRVAEAMRRFETAVGPSADHARFARSLSAAIIQAMHDSADEHLTAIAAGLLVGRFDGKKNEVVAEAGLLFDATSETPGTDAYPIWHSDIAAAVSDAMQHKAEASTDGGDQAMCALRGGTSKALLSGPFPNPNLPTLGPTFLFSRNADTPSLARYGEFDATMPVARSTAESLQAAAMALTLPQRQGKTWRSIPGERPKQTDLMLSYVAAAPDAPVAEVVTSERDLEQLTKELVEAVKARVGDAGLAQTPVRLTVLRRVDPGNRKAIASDTLSVARLESAARKWHAARRLLPPGLTLPVPEKKMVVDLAPPNVAPLGLISFTRPVFIRGGAERTDAVGITAAEALALFLDNRRAAALRAKRVLHMVLHRRTPLVVGCAHARWRGFDSLKDFDSMPDAPLRRETLRTVTVLCVLLHKLGLQEEKDMTDSPAYKLGQLLAAADAVHAGYCADVRGGQLPPSLLGNQVFTTAQKSPVTTLKMLAARWKPYDGWLKRNESWSPPERFLSDSKWKKRSDVKGRDSRGRDERDNYDRARAISSAIWARRAARLVTEQINNGLRTINADDVYRAELLLGYLTGPPAFGRGGAGSEPTNDEGNGK
jgi:hypothetical protein